jgi:hypothetical protein
MALDIKVDGLADLNRALTALSHTTNQSIGQALREEAEIEMTESKRRVPVDTGALRGSGRVVGPIDEGGDSLVRMEFGDAAAPYALYVHEDLEAFHKVGQAKYLESVLVESAPHLAQRVARRVARILGL